MCVPQEKIYNDSPNEFAEFLDSRRKYVFLSELGGTANPFVVEGIYELSEFKKPKCAECDVNRHYAVDPEWGDQACSHCERLAAQAEHDPVYTINFVRLAEFISSGIGCDICREFQKPGWLFGKLRGYDVYFAYSPTKSMCRALKTSEKSILIIGGNNLEHLTAGLETRIILLSRLLFVKDGRLNFAHEVIEEKIPQARRRNRREHPKSEGEPKKTQSRPPIQVYTPLYLTMIREWILNLHAKNETGTPSIDYINDWMRKNGRIDGVAPVSKWQTRRHINKLIGKAKGENIDPTFSVYWNGCTDERFISENHAKDISKTIVNLFKVANSTGFKVSPMRGMDAAEYADKVARR